MKTKSKGIYALIAVIAVVILLAVWMISSYNGLVSLSSTVTQQQSNIDADLQRRADLIPNLVATVKGYAAHETDAIKQVTDARAKLAGAKTNPDKAAASDQLDNALNRLLVVVENYPNLKANENFLALQDELAGTENRIKTARRDFNTSVNNYNVKARSFPTNIVAGMFGFKQAEYFQAAEKAKEAPTVSFGQ